MSVILLRITGPLQSWGTCSRFGERDTELEPTKSGMIGLLCAALGKPRDEKQSDGFPLLAELSALRMGVRIDREGIILRDFHTAGGGDWRGKSYGVAKSNGARPETVISNRYYLADAVFLVGFEGENSLLERLNQAIASPVWPLFLGRKSFVPSSPIRFNEFLVENTTLLEALMKPEWMLGLGHWQDRLLESDLDEQVRFVIEWRTEDYGQPSGTKHDVPLSFILGAQKYQLRCLREYFVKRRELIRVERACS